MVRLTEESSQDMQVRGRSILYYGLAYIYIWHSRQGAAAKVKMNEYPTF